MVEPPTPIPGDVATMETIQDEGPFEHDREPMRDVSSRSGRANADTVQPPAIRAPEISPASTNATKQRARLAPIVTSTNGADAPTTKPKTTLDASSASSKPAESIDRRAQMRRASFHPSAQPTAGYSRDVLLRSSFAVTGTAGDLLEDPASGDKALEDETLANVEELLEGFDWGSMDPSRGDEQRGGATEVFESRLLDELNALEAVGFSASSCTLRDLMDPLSVRSGKHPCVPGKRRSHRHGPERDRRSPSGAGCHGYQYHVLQDATECL
jgi:hypothetical protein